MTYHFAQRGTLNKLLDNVTNFLLAEKGVVLTEEHIVELDYLPEKKLHVLEVRV